MVINNATTTVNCLFMFILKKYLVSSWAKVTKKSQIKKEMSVFHPVLAFIGRHLLDGIAQGGAGHLMGMTLKELT